MTNSEMNIARLKELLLTYGAESERWPLAERPFALALIAHSDEARALVAEYVPVDELMNAGKNDRAPAGLIDRIMNVIDEKKS